MVLKKRATDNETRFNALVMSTGRLSKALSGESTQWENLDHEQEVDKLRQYAEDLNAIGEIILERKGRTGLQLVDINDQPVAEDMANRARELITRVETKMEMTLQIVKDNLSRQVKEKAKFMVEAEENARAEFRRARREAAAEDGGEAAQPNSTSKPSRFQLSEGSRPEIATVDFTYAQWQ